jgi:hypothetical protein
MEKNTSIKIGNRRKRGVGSIIGGVLLIGILMTSVLVYFVTVLNNEKAKTGYELQSEQQNLDKTAESYTVKRAETVTGGNIGIEIKNTGSLPMVASRSLVYCIEGAALGCETPSVPIENRHLEIGTSLVVLNPGDSYEENVGDARLTNNNTYRVDVISERGNIVSSTVCVLESGICADDEELPPEITGAITEGIIQGTGSLQLDFKSFGVIFPNYGTRNGVDQTGFSVKATNATGYPGTSIPRSDRVVLVERMRNLDPSQEDMTLTRQTGLAISLGKATGNTPTIVYLCNVNATTGTITGYSTDSVVLPYANPAAGRYEGMQDVFFCSKDEQSVTTNWDTASDTKFDNINGIFMVARGFFGATSDFYAQTIPYQSLYVANPINACLKAANTPGSGAGGLACPSTVNTAATNAGYTYHATAAQMQGPLTVQLRLQGTLHGPYSVDWVYPNSGRHITLTATPQNPNANGNIAITLPTMMEDGSTNLQPGFYTIVVTGAYYKNNPSDTQFTQDIAFMTFQVRT